MRNLLLPLGCSLLAITAAATLPESSHMIPNAESTPLKAIKGSTERRLRVSPHMQQSAVVNPTAMRAPARSADKNVLLYESFENPTSDPLWLPDGWTMRSDGDENLDTFNHWTDTKSASLWMPQPTDGEWYMGISYADIPQDEWLVSPSVSIPDGIVYQLSFYLYTNPFYFYETGGNAINWTTNQWNEQKIVSDFQVLVSADGGDFELVRSLAEEHMGESPIDLQTQLKPYLERYSVDLNGYEGKSIRIAFRYVGADGESIFFDQVEIALPEMTLSITPDFSTLYWGMTPDAWMGFNRSVAQYPVFAPITFYNTSYNNNVDYWWSYANPENGEMVSSYADDLLVEYSTNYSTPESTANNFYLPPVLHGEGPGYQDGSVAFDVDWLQAGGKASYVFKSGETLNLGLMTFDPNRSEVGCYTIDDEEIGDMELPVFGHDANTDKFWMNYTFHGDADPGDNVFVDAYMNYIYPTAAPLVVSGIWAEGIGFVSDHAEFKAEILPLVDVFEDGEWIGQTISETPLASAVCAGSEIFGRETSFKGHLTIPFHFDAPVVIDDSHDAYVVRISGFHSDEVQYFAPAQQWIPNKDDLALGWLQKQITFNGVTVSSISPIAYFQNEHGYMYSSFAINLDGFYPWLKTSREVVDLEGLPSASIPLDSYYDASELEVESSEWIHASASGRLGDAKLNITVDPGHEKSTGYVVLKGTGVELRLTIETGSGASAAAVASNPDIIAIHSVDGASVSLNSADINPGIYVATMSDGSSRKICVRR